MLRDRDGMPLRVLPAVADLGVLRRLVREEAHRLRAQLPPLGVSTDEQPVPVDQLAALIRLRRLAMALRRLESSSRPGSLHEKGPR